MPVRILILLTAFLAAMAHAEDGPRVVMTTNLGTIELQLDAERAPVTSANFVKHVQGGHYDGTIFHRVMSDFMIQGGGFTAQMERREAGDPIGNEADNGLSNKRGTIAMARTSDPHSAQAQFFINVVDNDFLDHRAKTMRGWGYAVFGHVVNGMDVVDRIRALPTQAQGQFQNLPVNPAIIIKAELAATGE